MATSVTQTGIQLSLFEDDYLGVSLINDNVLLVNK